LVALTGTLNVLKVKDEYANPETWVREFVEVYFVVLPKLKIKIYVYFHMRGIKFLRYIFLFLIWLPFNALMQMYVFGSDFFLFLTGVLEYIVK
jgi:hypothetical protein